MQILMNSKILTSIALSGCLVFSIVGIHIFPVFASPIVWSTGTDMPTPRSEAAYASLGTKIYVIGGAGNTSPGNKKIVEAYDTSTNKWTTGISSLPVAVNHAAADSYNGKIYVVGGYQDDRVPTNRLFIYDPSQNAWTEGASMPTTRAALVAKFINGILYAVGGANLDFKKLSTNEAYNPSTNTWSSKAPMPTARNHLSSAVVDGKIYSFGGEAPTFVFDKNEIYDTSTNTWSSGSSLPTARHGLTTVAFDSKIYVIGGGLQATTSKPATGVNEIFQTQSQSPPPADTISPQV